MNKSTIFLIVIIYSLMLSCAHLAWNYSTGPAEHKKVENGELAIASNLLNDNDYINLNGEWAFFPNELLMQHEIDESKHSQFIKVPGSWENNNLSSGSAIGIGTYYLKISAPSLQGELVGLRVNKIHSASQIFVNGELVSSLGKVSNKKNEVPMKKPKTFTFRSEEPTISIIVQVSNNDYHKVGGMIDTILLGESEIINKYTKQNEMLQVIAITILIIHIIYALILTLISVHKTQALYVTLVLSFLTCTILFDDDQLILQMINLSDSTFIRLKNFFYSGTTFFTLLFIIEALKVQGVKTRFVTYFLLFNGIIIIMQFLMPVNFYRDNILFFTVLWIITFILISTLVLKQLKYESNTNVILLIIITISLLTSSLWGGIKNALVLDILYYPFDIIITVIVFGLYLFLKVFHVFQKNMRMESALLQAQMQPHFIFNTLNSIISLSYIDQERMVKLLRNFSKYLRFSFRQINLKKLININDELEIVKAYIAIQQERFIGRIEVDWDVDKFTDEKIPPLTIQPLVENVIKHGVLSEYEAGKISIKVKHKQDEIYIEVSDNGKGMSEKKVKELLSKSSDTIKGIGIKNTNDRLIFQYKQGLKIKSAPGEGFKVSFSIPTNKKSIQ